MYNRPYKTKCISLIHMYDIMINVLLLYPLEYQVTTTTYPYSHSVGAY